MTQLPIISLDRIDRKTRDAKERQVVKKFKCYVFLVIVIESVLLSTTISFIVIYWDTGYVWDLFFRLPTLIRLFLLWIVLFCQKISVYDLLGACDTSKMIRYFYTYNTLGTWALTGFLDLYILRYTILVIDCILPWTLSGTRFLQIILYIFVDVLYIFEYYLSKWLLYERAVYYNIKYTFRLKKKSISLKGEMMTKLRYLQPSQKVKFSLPKDNKDSVSIDINDEPSS